MPFCPLVCFSNMVMMIEIASQRVEEPPVQQTTRSGRKPGDWSKRYADFVIELICSIVMQSN